MQYNEDQYNVRQYNADTNDVLNVLSDTMTITDATLIKSIGAVRIETVTSTDADQISDVDKALMDIIFSEDTLTKAITNKGLEETIRLAVWFKIERTPTINNPWGD